MSLALVPPQHWGRFFQAPMKQSLVHLSGSTLRSSRFNFGWVIYIGFYLKGAANTSEEFFMAAGDEAWIAG